jgi:hypothetical protein
MADESTTKSPEQAIRDALKKLADALVDASGLDVKTSIQIINAQNPNDKPSAPIEVASTHIAFDGDRSILAPVMFDTGDLRIPQAIYDLHERNVREAMAYRKEVLDALVDFVKTRRLG